ncbi:MAG: hypothetical protein V4519_03830 [Patescibacteria group bacterium]
MKKLWIGIVLVVAVFCVGATLLLNQPDAPQVTESPESLHAYFVESITAGVKSSLKDYEKLGLDGGVDGFALMKVYPNLIAIDFTNVTTAQGEYSMKNFKLVFTGNAASNSAVLGKEGMQTLLENTSTRFGITLKTKRDVDHLLKRIKGAIFGYN